MSDQDNQQDRGLHQGQQHYGPPPAFGGYPGTNPGYHEIPYAAPPPAGYPQPAYGRYAQSTPYGHAEPTPYGYAQSTPYGHAQPTPYGHAQPTHGHAQPHAASHSAASSYGHEGGNHSYGQDPKKHGRMAELGALASGAYAMYQAHAGKVGGKPSGGKPSGGKLSGGKIEQYIATATAIGAAAGTFAGHRQQSGHKPEKGKKKKNDQGFF